jgi:hypothetical protein
MSWNKNTICDDTIDYTVKILEDEKLKYNLITLGEVAGFGLNDEEGKTYPIRLLKYNNKFLIERMIRSDDCDLDDQIVTKLYKNNLPKFWWLEITIDDNGKIIKRKKKVNLKEICKKVNKKVKFYKNKL